MRVGYERHAIRVSYPVCLGTGCPTSSVGEERVIHVPASLGVRFSSAGRPPNRIGAFLDIAPTLTWTRFEEVARIGYADGRTFRDLRSSGHWLVGADLGAGFEHTLRGALGFEWGIRYAYLNAPRETEATRRLGVGRDPIQRWSVVAAVTLAP